MRRLLAILFSAALIGAQGVPDVCAQAAPSPAGQSPCACCHCSKGSCCMNKTESQPQPAPAAPAPDRSQASHLLLIVPAMLAFTLPAPAHSSFPPSAAAESHAAALPLYQRNCAFLI